MQFIIKCILLLLIGDLFVDKVIGNNDIHQYRKKEQKGLKLEVSLSSPTSCAGESIKTNLKVTNNSQISIRLNISNLWSMTSFTRTLIISRNSKKIENHVVSAVRGVHSQDRYLILPPGKSYTEEKLLETANEFFVPQKEYEISITYVQLSDETENRDKLWVGIVDSNKVKVFLNSCVKK